MHESQCWPAWIARRLAPRSPPADKPGNARWRGERNEIKVGHALVTRTTNDATCIESETLDDSIWARPIVA